MPLMGKEAKLSTTSQLAGSLRNICRTRTAGLMPLLDEEVKLPRGGDSTWLGKCKQHNAEHPSLASAPGGNPNRFVVRHYAGEVGYDCGGFVDTNRDNLFRDLYDIMSSSQAPITKVTCQKCTQSAVLLTWRVAARDKRGRLRLRRFR